MRPFIVFLGTSALALGAPALHAAPGGDWPSYNRTVDSARFSPLDGIKPANAGAMKVVCTFDTGESTGFQSGLVQVDGALFATTEHDTFSIDPDTCKLNWRMHEEFKSSYLRAQRGVAIENGRVFRGGSDGNVYAYDEKTGARLWHT
jgi:glucose dehydrogenase